MFSLVWKILLHNWMSIEFFTLTSATVNFCNIAIQLITYLRLDSQIATAIF